MYAQGWCFLFFKEEKNKLQKENATFWSCYLHSLFSIIQFFLKDYSEKSFLDVIKIASHRPLKPAFDKTSQEIDVNLPIACTVLDTLEYGEIEVPALALCFFYWKLPLQAGLEDWQSSVPFGVLKCPQLKHSEETEVSHTYFLQTRRNLSCIGALFTAN